jgi:hypothetical protein
VVLSLLLAGAAWTALPQPPVILENPHFRFAISPDGKCLSFTDRATGQDYLKTGAPAPCALVRCEAKDYPVSQVWLTNGHLLLRFGEPAIEVALKVEPRPSHVRLTVQSTRGKPFESLVFLNVPLTLRGVPDESFGACAFSLNLMTRVDALPALQSELRASCGQKFGVVGAKAALVAAPMSGVLPALKEVLLEADEMPLCKVAGPWASEVPFNHGSYLFNFGSLTETNVDEWISMGKSLGVTQIDNHGGSAAFFRFGDFLLNREKWPEGWETYARIVARLHAVGIGSIFHTYAFFIDKQSKYVTPVPDPRLDAFRTFTLADAITAEADSIPVNEPTAGLSTVTGFFEHNSVLLHLGEELVTFGGMSQAPPWHFTRVKRGALGTRAAWHAKGDKARHLKECFGLLVPNPASSLFEEIAANHAEVVHRAGFDGLYLDAIDGSGILRGNDECWYWGDKFVFEIQKRLKKPVGMEMSAMWHHCWQYRTRWQAWDYPQRGHQRFIDIHAAGVNGGLLLPLHLGWWNFQSFDPPQIEPSYPEVIEYLGAKLIGWDAGISLTGAIDRERLRTVPLFRRDVDILRTCEELRHAGAFDPKVKAQLRQPGQEFALVTDGAGKPRFRRAHSDKHTAALAEPWTLAWGMTNPFVAQPLRVRIEALMSAAAYDEPKAVVLADFSGAPAAEWKPSSAAGVTVSLRAGADGVALVATNAGQVPRHAAWARFDRKFTPLLNLKAHQALGLRIEGDGLGELMAIRLESPQHLAFGAVADRYLDVDFTGKRLVTLVETESARWNDYVWNDGKSGYNIYRETIDFGKVESASVWVQNLAPGKETQCRIGPIKAIPMVSATLKDPAIAVNGNTAFFPVEIPSGGWLECASTDDCTLYDAKGAVLSKVIPRGVLPSVRAGQNEAVFSCAPANGPSPRARLTIFCRGDEL